MKQTIECGYNEPFLFITDNAWQLIRQACDKDKFQDLQNMYAVLSGQMPLEELYGGTYKHIYELEEEYDKECDYAGEKVLDYLKGLFQSGELEVKYVGGYRNRGEVPEKYNPFYSLWMSGWVRFYMYADKSIYHQTDALYEDMCMGYEPDDIVSEYNRLMNLMLPDVLEQMSVDASTHVLRMRKV